MRWKDLWGDCMMGKFSLHIPKGKVIKDPIYHVTSGDVTEIIVEPFAEVSVIEENQSYPHSERHIHVQEGGKLQYIHIQRCSKDVDYSETQEARIEKDGSFQSIHVGLGAQQTKSNLHTILEGKGALAKVSGVIFGDHSQKFDMYTTQDHEASDTSSDLLFKAALKDSAKSNYEGVIHIPKSSQKVDAYQTNKNLLLSENAKARSIPKLEILADDVRCKHGATIGTIDEAETFYLQSRGLSYEEARSMIVEGFFEQVFEKIPHEETRQKLHEVIKLKLKEGE